MAEFQSANSINKAADLSIDVGLRAHMTKVYGLMAVAMIITGLVAYAVGTSPSMLAAIFNTPMKWVVMFAPLGVVFFFGAKINSMRYETAQLVFGFFLVWLDCQFHIFSQYIQVSQLHRHSLPPPLHLHR